MDTDDQVAIHEAMEQQTISIAKAGIKATLNARTSILAAANPIGGRYDTRKPLKANVGLSPPIMSRFDLFFVVLDDLSPEADYRLADHIVGLHQQGEASLPTHYTPEDFLLFRRKGKNMHPILTEGAQRMLVACYRDLRQNDKTKKNNSYRITTRQLESMIRLSEAVARVHLSQEVKEEHVKLALHVMRSSFTRVEQPSVEVVMPRGTAEEAKTKGKSKDSAVEKVPMEHYQRIRVLLLTKLCSTDEITRKGISENELKQWYFDTVQEVQEAALLQEVELVDKVLERLIAEEAITVITVLDEVGDQPEASGNRLLAIHPNLPPDSIAQDTR
uniref:MCM C-terminal AAA(+) ATPase domain-containing protein n=1 Tax=Eutreptiella gymnastica TaxID=73025 RepID=A0A7S4CWA9_9EUGL